ncbi:hypothetical protein [Bradyrhizobium sp. HKCCYLS3013]|uniref:hypothetical protein n=1 Tax=Bradyrhizobium sp. HKCCYLS3013 TaxID=3420735 RepID=UPI003EC04B9E
MRLFYHMLHYWRGARCLKIEDFPGAILHFSKVIQLNPRNYYAYHNRGVALQGREATPVRSPISAWPSS